MQRQRWWLVAAPLLWAGPLAWITLSHVKTPFDESLTLFFMWHASVGAAVALGWPWYPRGRSARRLTFGLVALTFAFLSFVAMLAYVFGFLARGDII